MFVGLLIVCAIVIGFVMLIASLSAGSTKAELLEKANNPNVPSSWMGARSATKQAERQAGVIRIHDRLKEAILDSEQVEKRNQQRVEKDDMAHREEIATKSLNIHLTEGAQASEMTVNDFSDFNKSVASKNVELQARAIEFGQDQEDATRAQLEEYEQNDNIRQRLFRAYEERKALEISDDPAKDDKLALLNRSIAKVEAILDARENRQIQAAGGRVPAAALPENTSRGDDTAALGST